MVPKVKIDEIVEAMKLQFNTWNTFLNIKTGEIVYVSDDELQSAEDDELSDWELDDVSAAIDILENEADYIELPTQFDINEYHMITTFCHSVEDSQIRSQLLAAVRGKGAFRRFKDLITQYEIEDEWYAYRDKCYREIAIRWCQNNGIEWAD